MEKRSYRNNPMTIISMCTYISRVGWDTHGTNTITKDTGTIDKPRLNTIKGNLFLIVNVPTRMVPWWVPVTLIQGRQTPGRSPNATMVW